MRKKTVIYISCPHCESNFLCHLVDGSAAIYNALLQRTNINSTIQMYTIE